MNDISTLARQTALPLPRRKTIRRLFHGQFFGIFNTSSIAFIKDCCCFYFKLPSELLERRLNNSCPNVVSDHVRDYYMTHCELIALL